MMFRHGPTFIVVLLCTAAASASAADTADYFEKNVRPVLVDHCLQCHGPEKQKSDLRLDSAAAFGKGGKHGAIAKPGDPAGSLIVQAVSYTGDLKMPPDAKLPQAAIDAITAWVAQGARWPESAAPLAMKTGIDYEAGRKHWSYAPLGAPAAPAVKDAAWPRNDIDRFILSKIENANLTPAPPADKRTLIRRITYDLIGLPPTPEEVDAFLADTAPEAFAKVIDRLLASPQYGERWGRHWLDVVRYTDSFDSRASAQTDPAEIWRYRDWVVRALNEDMPYDKFLQKQIAGDLLPTPDGKFDRDGMIATGVLAIGNWPQGDADKQKMVTDIVDDQIDLVMRGMLGVTFTCARCHDHKFDPFSANDYYSLAGIFFSTSILPGPGAKTEGSPILHLPLASKEDLAARKAREERLAALGKERDTLRQQERAAWAEQESAKTAHYMLAAYRQYGRNGAADPALNPEVVRRWARFLGMGGYPTLDKVDKNIQSMPGLHARHNADSPSATANTTDREIKFVTITAPAHSFLVHPSPSGPARIAWRSPIAGRVAVEGRLADADGNCGNGVDWTLDLASRGQHRKVGEGEIPNGGQASFTANSILDVRAGDLLTFSILPKNDYSCDSTVVGLRVSAETGEVWNLASDVLPKFTEGNPWPDAAGHPAVWWALDGGDVGAPDPILFAPWWAALDTRPGDETALRSAATIIQSALDTASQISSIKSQIEAARVAGNPASLPSFASMQSLASIDPARKALITENGPFWLDAPPAVAGTHRAEVENELAQLEANAPPPLDLVVGIQEGGVPNTEHVGTHDVRVHKRGSYTTLGDMVPRQFPVVFAGDKQAPITEGSGRLQLAQWVGSPDNPLAARVMVNRIWMHLFGQGLVRTPGDFGKRGEAPTHPELLDYLAQRFIQSGWSVKALMREITNTAAYQQSVAVNPGSTDPENRLIARMNRKRLEAEALRDSLLAASGRLDLTMGGPAYKDLNTPRRTLYLRCNRSDRTSYPILFDAADPTAIIPQRTEATVAPQALFLMNDSFALDEAQALAQRVQPLAGDFPKLIDTLYQRLYSRPPGEKDLGLARDYLGGAAPPTKESLTAYAQVLLSANEFMFVD